MTNRQAAMEMSSGNDRGNWLALTTVSKMARQVARSLSFWRRRRRRAQMQAVSDAWIVDAGEPPEDALLLLDSVARDVLWLCITREPTWREEPTH
jgi:hypothetical protein